MAVGVDGGHQWLSGASGGYGGEQKKRTNEHYRTLDTDQEPCYSIHGLLLSGVQMNKKEAPQ
jgi:hypothetical protein